MTFPPLKLTYSSWLSVQGMHFLFSCTWFFSFWMLCSLNRLFYNRLQVLLCFSFWLKVYGSNPVKGEMRKWWWVNLLSTWWWDMIGEECQGEREKEERERKRSLRGHWSHQDSPSQWLPHSDPRQATGFGPILCRPVPGGSLGFKQP